MSYTNPVFVTTPSHETSKYFEKKINEKVQESKASKMSALKIAGTTALNTLLVLTLLGLVILMDYDVIPFKTLGFTCNDPKLSHKFQGDTIPFGYLLAVNIVAPLVTMLIVEFFVLKSTFSYYSPSAIGRLKVTLYWYGQFLLGHLILLFLMQLMKSIVGEPRPHFFDTCKPDKNLNCSSGYFLEYKCTNTEMPEREVRDSSKSFPSGHTCMSIYTSIFLVWYLQNRIPRNEFLLVPFFQCLFMTWGIFCSLTRLTDKRHHWWDVLAGAALGTLLAYLTVKFLCDEFDSYILRSDKSESGSSLSNRRRRSPGSSSTRQDRKDGRGAK